MDTLTPLARWMKDAAINDAQLAGRVGCDRTTITRLRQGKTTPSLALVARILAVAEGRLSANDFLPSAEAA